MSNRYRAGKNSCGSFYFPWQRVPTAIEYTKISQSTLDLHEKTCNKPMTQKIIRQFCCQRKFINEWMSSCSATATRQTRGEYAIDMPQDEVFGQNPTIMNEEGKLMNVHYFTHIRVPVEI